MDEDKKIQNEMNKIIQEKMEDNYNKQFGMTTSGNASWSNNIGDNQDILADIIKMKEELGPPPPNAIGCNKSMLGKIAEYFKEAKGVGKETKYSGYPMLTGIAIIELPIVKDGEIITGDIAVLAELKKQCDSGDIRGARLKLRELILKTKLHEIYLKAASGEIDWRDMRIDMSDEERYEEYFENEKRELFKRGLDAPKKF